MQPRRTLRRVIENQIHIRHCDFDPHALPEAGLWQIRYWRVGLIKHWLNTSTSDKTIRRFNKALIDATWVVREHRVEYLLSALAGEEIEIRTWVENIRRVRSLRKYEFVRKRDGNTLVKGETDWVFVNVKTGSPLAIPAEVANIFKDKL